MGFVRFSTRENQEKRGLGRQESLREMRLINERDGEERDGEEQSFSSQEKSSGRMNALGGFSLFLTL